MCKQFGEKIGKEPHLKVTEHMFETQGVLQR